MTFAGKTKRVHADVVSLIPALRSFARRLCREQWEVDDLVQETLMRALANVDKFEEGTRLKSWLFTIMRNTFSTRYSVNKRYVIGLDDFIALVPAVPPSQEWSIRGRELERAMDALPDGFRQAANLILIDGASYEEAAGACGCKVGTVKSRVNRARSFLAAHMGDNVGNAALM